jgi:hypothetical protein
MEGLKFYKKSNNILGWLVFAVALLVYTLTMEKSGSFWDCGEFIAGAYKLQVVHPPGAPFFNILGRFLTLFAFGNPEYVSIMINFMSALSTAFVVLFCFWSTTAIARKIFMKEEADYTQSKIFAVLGSGLVAGLACTFLDSLWFSAGEGEVYALSMFFMTFVVWAALKWDADDSPNADRWLVLIAFMIGLSTGVHLLSMLVIPFVCLIVYFKKFKPSLMGFAAAFGISFVLIGFIMKGIIAGIPAIYSKADLFFVNSLGMGFNTGVIFASVVMIAALAGLHFYAVKKQNVLMQNVLFGLTTLLIGYSTFLMVPIRSEANPPINMNRPTDPFSMLSYLNREQYGERPIVFGPAYNVDQYDIKREPNGQVVKVGLRNRWAKGTDKYDNIGEKFDYTFENSDMMFFPRLGVWNDPSKLEAYRAWLNPDHNVWDRENKRVVTKFPGGKADAAEQYAAQLNAQNDSRFGSQRYTVKDDLTWGHNIRFFLQFQVGYMYMRYLMWNFSGRQNDIQGRYDNSEGGWITGINFIDNNLTLWGNPSWPMDNLSPIRKANKALNKFYGLPFILGIIGMIFLFRVNWQMGLAVFVMFLTTGLFFIVYGNQPPIEPRERDYALVGSFFTYAIWVGFAVYAIFDKLKNLINHNAAAISATAMCLVAPVLMGAEGWDDHNRSGRTTTVDFARNYLESCLPNAIIFTQGDNDTYPLWYAQEVEGIRKDVRVVNLSLLGVDWYINQLRYKMNDAAPVKLTFTPDMIRGSNRDYVRYMQNPKLDQNRYYDAQSIMQFVAKDDPVVKQQIDDPYYLPTRRLSFPVSAETRRSTNMVHPDKDSMAVEALEVELNKANLMKNDLLTVDIIANNINERPIYFAVSVSPSAYMGFQKYFVQEGFTYRIVPLVNTTGSPQQSPARSDIMFDNIMNKFRWGKIGENPNIYLDENILRMTLNLISNFSKLSAQLVEEGECEKAVALIDKCFKELPVDRVPYNYFHSDFPKVLIACGQTERAKEMALDMLKTGKGELDYYVHVYQDKVRWAKKRNPAYLEELARGTFAQKRDVAEYLYIFQQLGITFKATDAQFAKQFEDALQEYSEKLRNTNI